MGNNLPKEALKTFKHAFEMTKVLSDAEHAGVKQALRSEFGTVDVYHKLRQIFQEDFGRF